MKKRMPSLLLCMAMLVSIVSPAGAVSAGTEAAVFTNIADDTVAEAANALRGLGIISGEDGLKTALAMGENMTVYYDRTVAAGAQVRVIVIEK